MDSRTWDEACELARKKALAASKKVSGTYGEIIARIRFGPKGPGKVRAEIVETLPEE